METLLWIGLCIYLLVGAAQASRNISKGVVGAAGPLATFIFVTAFWPFVDRH